MNRRHVIRAGAGGTTLARGTFAQGSGASTDMARSHQAPGVAVTPEECAVVSFSRWTDDVPVSVVGLSENGSLRPCPDERWTTRASDGRPR